MNSSSYTHKNDNMMSKMFTLLISRFDEIEKLPETLIFFDKMYIKVKI